MSYTVEPRTKDIQSSGRVEGLRVVGETFLEYDVLFSTDVPIAQQTLLSLNASGIPSYWEPHPYDPWSYVSSKSEWWINANMRRVRVNYSTIEDPFAQEPIWSYTFSGTNEPIDRDKDNKPIINVVKESPDPPLTEEFHDLVVHYNHNWQAYNPLIAADYQNAINSNAYLIAGYNYPARTVLIRNFSGEPMRAGAILYWNVTMEFHIRYDANDEGKPENERKGEWVRRVVNEGFRERKEINGDIVEALDVNGNKYSSPIQLDENGVKIAEGDPIYLLAFNTKRERDFTTLNIT